MSYGTTRGLISYQEDLAKFVVSHVEGEYRIRTDDQSGDAALYRAVSVQLVDLADMIDDLLSGNDEVKTAN